MIKYEDYLSGSSPDMDDMSKDALWERGKFLVEVVDKNSPLDYKSLMEDMSQSSSMRRVIPYAPSAGKTTAVRQLIVMSSMRGGVYATKLLDDIDSIYYDVKSHQTYINNHMSSVVKFSSKDDTDLSIIRSSDWILCSHMRVLMEPSTVLTVHHSRDPLFPVSTNRAFFFIDEYPSNTYHYTRVIDVLPMVMMDSRVKELADVESISNFFSKEVGYIEGKDYYEESLSLARKHYMRNQLESANPEPQGYLMNNISTLVTSESLLAVQGMNKNSNEYKMKSERMVFFANHFINKYYKSGVVGTASDMTSKLYYSLYDLANEVPITVLDGTSDLVLGKLDAWEVVKSTNPVLTNRYLNLNKVSMISTYSKRDNPLRSIVNEYAGIIEDIRKDHPDEQILVYTWKFSKGSNDVSSDDSIKDEESNSIKDILLIELESRGIDNVEIITYMSGEEKGTNKYSTASVAVILGEFFIPNSVIYDMNNSLGDTNQVLTSEDYTLSLLIQFLYRTRARKRNIEDNSISLYIDHRYENLLKKLYSSIQIKGTQLNEVVPTMSKELRNSKAMKLREYTQGDYMIRWDTNDYIEDGLHELYVTTSSKLAEMLGIKSTEKRRLLSKIDSIGLPKPMIIPRVNIEEEGQSRYTVYLFSPILDLDNVLPDDINLNRSDLISVLKSLII